MVVNNRQIKIIKFDLFILNFLGLAILDFESWRPIYQQNFGSLQPYRDISFEQERKKHPKESNVKITKLVYLFTYL